MQTVSLGASGLKISEIGLGALQASGRKWSADIRDKEIISAIKRSYELGINFIDTAEAYGGGHSEQVVGKAVKEIGRDNLIIATKVNGSHLRFVELQKACNASMQRLGLREIDLYQIHWPDPWEQIPLRETFKAMEKLHSEGKIRAIGVCNFAVRDLEEVRSFLSHTEIVSNQVRYNLIQREVEKEVLPYCKRNGITVIAWSPIAQGALGGKYGVGMKPNDKLRANYPLFSDENMREISKLLGLLKSFAQRRNKTIAQVAINWLLSKPTVIPIPGAKNRKQAEENAGASEWRLAKDEIYQLERMLEKIHISYYP